MRKCECGKELDNGDAFCPKCGKKYEEKKKNNDNKGKIFCTRCGEALSADSNFCNKCGNTISKDGQKFCPNCGTKLDSESNFCNHCGMNLTTNYVVTASPVAPMPIVNYQYAPRVAQKTCWNFNNKLITISFFACAILATLIASSGELYDELLRHILPIETLGIVLIIIGCLIMFVCKKNQNSPYSNDIESLSKLVLTKNIVGLSFITSGLICILHPFQFGGETEFSMCFLLLMSFGVFLCSLVYSNGDKMDYIFQYACLIISLIGFVASAIFYSMGKSENNDYYNQVQSFFETGRVNPGDDLINMATYIFIGSIVFLIGFFVLRSKNNKKMYY